MELSSFSSFVSPAKSRTCRDADALPAPYDRGAPIRVAEQDGKALDTLYASLTAEERTLFDELCDTIESRYGTSDFGVRKIPVDTIIMRLLLELCRKARNLERALFMLQQMHHDPVMGEPIDTLVLPPNGSNGKY